VAAFVTRFAPSPTGLPHLGHAVSALTARDMAAGAEGVFLLRIEDLDTARRRPEHEAAVQGRRFVSEKTDPMTSAHRSPTRRRCGQPSRVRMQ